MAASPVRKKFKKTKQTQSWRVVTSETGHATGIQKAGHAIEYFMGS